MGRIGSTRPAGSEGPGGSADITFLSLRCGPARRHRNWTLEWVVNEIDSAPWAAPGSRHLLSAWERGTRRTSPRHRAALCAIQIAARNPVRPPDHGRPPLRSRMALHHHPPGGRWFYSWLRHLLRLALGTIGRSLATSWRASCIVIVGWPSILAGLLNEMEKAERRHHSRPSVATALQLLDRRGPGHPRYVPAAAPPAATKSGLGCAWAAPEVGWCCSRCVPSPRWGRPCASFIYPISTSCAVGCTCIRRAPRSEDRSVRADRWCRAPRHGDGTAGGRPRLAPDREGTSRYG